MRIQLLSMFALALFSFIPGCTKPYETPVFDDGKEELGASHENVRFTGLASQLKGQNTVRVFWVHGMCHHDDKWAEHKLQALRSALDVMPASNVDISGNMGDPSNDEMIRIGLHIDFPLWSSKTANLKGELKDSEDFVVKSFENPGSDFPYTRAKLNRKVKQKLMNDCLADAVIMAGVNRKQTYEYVREGLCTFLGGKFTGPKECRLADNEAPDTKRAIIAESLGSKIVADAVYDLEPAPGLVQEKIFEARLSTIRQIFLVSNQIPFLSLAGDPEDRSKNQSEDETESKPEDPLQRMVSRILKKASAVNQTAPIQIVAFTDPNDLLSYRLTEESFPDKKKVRLVNVIVSNGYTISPLIIPSFERPDLAHCDYFGNPHVLGMIVMGNPGQPTSWEKASQRMVIKDAKGCKTPKKPTQ
ncbi:MAG: hypothetical protein KUG59_06615 [Parvibaculaceae bacterium]|nr:hypothetical protein [Parvibaculaceae bacterium]